MAVVLCELGKGSADSTLECSPEIGIDAGSSRTLLFFSKQQCAQSPVDQNIYGLFLVSSLRAFPRSFPQGCPPLYSPAEKAVQEMQMDDIWDSSPLALSCGEFPLIFLSGMPF